MHMRDLLCAFFDLSNFNILMKIAVFHCFCDCFSNVSIVHAYFKIMSLNDWFRLDLGAFNSKIKFVLYISFLYSLKFLILHLYRNVHFVYNLQNRGPYHSKHIQIFFLRSLLLELRQNTNIISITGNYEILLCSSDSNHSCKNCSALHFSLCESHWKTVRVNFPFYCHLGFLCVFVFWRRLIWNSNNVVNLSTINEIIS